MLDQETIDRITAAVATEVLNNVDFHIARWKEAREKQISYGSDTGLAPATGLGGDILQLIADLVTQAWSWVDAHKDPLLSDAMKGLLVNYLRSILNKPKGQSEEAISVIIQRTAQEVIEVYSKRENVKNIETRIESGGDEKGDNKIEERRVRPLQFTVYHPKEIRPATWYTLLVYAHIPSAREAVQIDSRKRLGAQKGSYGKGESQTTQTIARGTEIVVVPELPGCRFNPPHAKFLWLEDWHRVEFRQQAMQDLPGFALGVAVNGRVAFYVGPILVAEVKVWAYCTEKAEISTADSPETQATANAYQAIFPSYSHTDTALVEQLEKAYSALGMQSLRDVYSLRSGEKWNAVLLRKIEEADIFQLYWSHNAKRSLYVEQEWRHALAQARPSFIRPLYWEEPLPDPPQELTSIHFAYYNLKE